MKLFCFCVVVVLLLNKGSIERANSSKVEKCYLSVYVMFYFCVDGFDFTYNYEESVGVCMCMFAYTEVPRGYLENVP